MGPTGIMPRSGFGVEPVGWLSVMAVVFYPGLFMKIVARGRKWLRGKEGEPQVGRRID